MILTIDGGISVSNLNENATVDVPCAKCGHKTPQSIGWLKGNTQFTCQCGGVVSIESKQFLGELGKIDQTIGDLKRRFKWIK